MTGTMQPAAFGQRDTIWDIPRGCPCSWVPVYSLHRVAGWVLVAVDSRNCPWHAKRGTHS